MKDMIACAGIICGCVVLFNPINFTKSDMRNDFVARVDSVHSMTFNKKNVKKEEIALKNLGKAVIKYTDENEAQVEFYSIDGLYKFNMIDENAKKPSILLDRLVYNIYKDSKPYFIDYECTRYLAAVEGSKSACKLDKTLPMCIARCDIYKPSSFENMNFNSYLIYKRIARSDI